jgi:hypothetical protein
MFEIIYCFLPFLFFIFQFYFLKKRKSLSWEIKKGHICYNCKESLNISEKEIWDRMMKSDDYSKLCLSCNRDRKLSQLENPILIWKHKLQKIMVTKKFEKIHIKFLPIVFLLIVLDVILLFLGIKLYLWILYGSLNIIWWSMITYKTYYTSQKKPSE